MTYINNIQRIQRLKLSCTLNDNGKERHFHHGHEYIEIGGLKWATMNIGAQKVTDNGLYFQWGDTKGYTASQVGNGRGRKYFGWEDYKYGNSIYKTVLDVENDVVRVNWGGQWHMPTTTEVQSLGSAVDAVWIKNYQGSGVNGVLCVDKTDKSKVLFFPAVGFCGDGIVYNVGIVGCYWSSSLYSNCPHIARGFRFNLGNPCWNYYGYRFLGFNVRGVVG